MLDRVVDGDVAFNGHTRKVSRSLPCPLSPSLLCTAPLLPELQPAPCFLSAIIEKKLINPGVSDLSSHNNNNQAHLHESSLSNNGRQETRSWLKLRK